MTPLRVGIVGGGWIARIHVPALDASPGVELVAACDTEIERAEAIAGPRGARAYARWEDMLEHEELDALWVCTPPLHHRGPVLSALGAACTCTWRSRSLAPSRTPTRSSRRRAPPQRSAPWATSGTRPSSSTTCAQALAGQQVGLLLGRNFGPTAGRPWFMDQALGGGQILERGSHHIDLQRAIAGEISAVQAVAGTIGLAQDGPPGSIADAISLVLHFESGALGTVHAAWLKEGQPGVYSTDIMAPDVTLALELGPAHRLTGPLARRRRRDRARRADGPLDRAIPRRRPRR